MVQEKEKDSVHLLRRCLKERLQRDYSNVFGYEKERDRIGQLLQRTVETGESNSLLLIGPRGVGKTTLINAVLVDVVEQCGEFLHNTLVVHLNGNLHTDDKLALKAITLQLRLENAVDGRVFGSFAENLAFLLACLKSGDRNSKSIIFILDEFDLFCSHHKQTLLYNLFDVAQSAQAPICVLGVSCRLDVVQLLEKRVKSRFSHRQIFLFPNNSNEHLNFEQFLNHIRNLLQLPEPGQPNSKELKRLKCLEKLYGTNDCFRQPHFDIRNYNFSKEFRLKWNEHIQELIEDSTIQNALNTFHFYGVTLAHLKKFLFRLVAKLRTIPSTPGKMMMVTINSKDFLQLLDEYTNVDDKIKLLNGLSVLEFCLIIAMKHHTDIYDRDPFNFAIIFQRFHKFARTSNSMQGIERMIAMKAYENLRHLEFIIPVTASSMTSNTTSTSTSSGGGSNSSKIQKEFEMHRLTLLDTQILQAVQQYQSMPTEITQWAQSCLV